MQATELTFLDWIQTDLRSDLLDTLMPAVTSLGNGGILWIVTGSALLMLPKHRKTGAAIAAALALEALCCNVVLKPLVGRVRPCDINTAVRLLIPRPGDLSFPSGHTGAAFAAVGAMAACRDRLWIPALILALLIAFSRLYLYVHYPTDVLAGMVLGLMTGWLGSILSRPLAGKLQSGA